MALKKLKPKKGRLLISKPYLHDPYFKRSVVLLTEHNKEGSIGFILNKEVDISIDEAIEEFPEIDSKLFLGGPVQKDSLYYIHSIGDTISDSVEIGKGIYWGGNFEVLKILLESKKIKQSELKFFMGYSGWSAEQLDNELKNDSWIVAEMNDVDVINGLPDELWPDILRGLGKEYEFLANFPEHPSLN